MPDSPDAAPPPEFDRPFPLWGYLVLNAAIWLLSAGLYWAVKWFVGDTTGILFFSIMLPAGFGAVSILDAVYDRSRGARPGDEPQSHPASRP